MKPSIIIKHRDRLKTRRAQWESLWQDVTDYVLPRKNNIYTNYSANRGQAKTTLYDATAPHANELLASALHSMLSNPELPFFELITGDIRVDSLDDVRAWLQECQRIMHTVLSNTNFQTEIHEIYLDLGALGTAVLKMLEDDDLFIRFESKPIFEIYIDENSRGIVDTVYRDFKWTVRQIVQEWGEEALNERLRKVRDSDPLEEVAIIHAVYPREDKDKDKKKGSKGKPWVSIYILEEDEHILHEGGFDEFPYAIPRWTKTSGEIHGRSPAAKGLPDIMMINQMKKTTIRSAQKMVDPPMQAPDDGIALPIKTSPNAFNYYRRGTKDRIEPILTGGRIDFGFQVITDVRTSIREAFFIDRLQLNEGPQMTATEVRQRTEENIRVLGPLLGRLHSELLAPLITRLYGILTRKKILPPPPAALANKSLQVKYSSMIAKAQRTGEGQNLGRALQDVGVLLQLDPRLTDNIDGDEAMREALRLHGVSEGLIRSKRDRDKGREEAAKMAQEQQRLEQEKQEVETAVTAGKMQEGVGNVI